MLALRGCLTFAELWYKSLSDDVSTGNWKFILQHTTTRNASVHMPAVDFVKKEILFSGHRCKHI